MQRRRDGAGVLYALLKLENGTYINPWGVFQFIYFGDIICTGSV